MKFNERELATWASTFVPDKEGLLEKRGAGISHGYRLRWFRLKGNLIFYFKVDDSGDWQNTGDPVGVILLERVTVDRFHSDSKPYSFVLNFEGDDTRAYFLTAYSESDMVGWIKAIQMASYENLKAMLYQLQNRLTSLTGEDPLQDKHVSFVGPQISPHKITRQVHDAKRSLYIRSSNTARAKKLSVPPLDLNPQYELNLSCSSLPLNKDGKQPNTVIRVRSYKLCRDRQALATIGHTDIVQSSVSPNFTHLILLEIGHNCPSTAILEFEVFSVNDFQILPALDSSCKLTLPKHPSSSVILEDQQSSNEAIELRKGVCIGRAECNVSLIIAATKELKLPLSVDNLVCGFLNIIAIKIDEGYTKLSNVGRRNALNPINKSPVIGYLPTIMSHSVRCHFCFPATIDGESVKLKVIEEMAESAFNVQVPIELLKCYIKEDTTLLEELNAIGALEAKWNNLLLYYQEMLIDSITFYKGMIQTLEDLGDTCGFKQSTQKRDPDLQMLLCNLHIQKFRVQDINNVAGGSCYMAITSGCPADHVGGFKNGGLKRMLSECRSCPSFISKWTESRESSLNHIRVRLHEIKNSIYSYNAALYRACANANPHNMNDAMIGISREIQQLLFLMESDTVKDTIEFLIKARPCTSGVGMQSSSDTSILTGSLDASSLFNKDKRFSMRRKSVATPSAKCNCGKCSKCIPSPSDWVWNGSEFVQVSREWKMSDSSDSIQSSLCALIENVEAATRKVVDQQHLAVAQEVGLKIGTFRPTFVWSLELIPMFARLNQTLEGLFKITSSSLSFAILHHDSHVQGLKLLKRRRDIVFSQVLTALVSSFYTILSQKFLDSAFLRQISEIGFLVQFESLLSSLGDEIGMLEDMCVAVAELATVQFQLAELRGGENIPFDFHISGTRDSMIVQFLLSREVLTILPDLKLQQGRRIKVVPIMFAQGINEKQTLANLKHDLLLQSSLKLQDDINNRSMKLLSGYIEKFEKFSVEIVGNSSSKLQAVKIKDLHNLLQQSHSSQKSKNIEFLLTVEQLVHCLQGGRLTSCKSGKDRTGMSITLEECCFLRNYHHLDSGDFSTTLSTLRSHGTRLENCFKNTGHRCYHFNQLQLMLLPRLLTPPPFTCRDPE